jgi:hypothetical protein
MFNTSRFYLMVNWALARLEHVRSSSQWKRAAVIAKWYFCNEFNYRDHPDRIEYGDRLQNRRYGVSRIDEVREYGKQLFDDSLLSSKAIDERTEKLFAATLIAAGWVASKQWSVLSFLVLLFAAITLLCGRWKIQSSIPVTYYGFADMAGERSKEKDDEFQFNLDMATQYALAAWENNHRASLSHKRLLIAIILLIAGLAIFAFGF